MTGPRDLIDSPSITSPALGLFQRLRSMRIGIAGHLALSFAAVAVLAIVANVIAEQGISIVEITRFATAPVAPAVEHEVEALPPVVVPTFSAGPTAEVAGPADVVKRYSGAVLVRAQLPSRENDASVAEALRQLREMQATLEQRPAPHLKKFVTALSRYPEHGDNLVAKADEARTLIESYSAALSSMDLRLGASVDKGWKIFGRVLTRETVLKLRADYDTMERAFLTFRGTRLADTAPAMEALADSEAAFEATLRKSQRGLMRGEGREWFLGLAAELDQVRSLRLATVDASQTLQAATVEFDEARTTLEAAPEPSAVAVEITRSPAPFVGPLIEKPFVGPPIDVFPGSVHFEPPTLIDRRESDEPTRLLVALLTGGVLTMVLLVSIGTVRSIVVPIRRLLKATHDLGKHGVHERVPRGGIRELDTLGQSFNDMAEELLAARRAAQAHHLVLEERVAERTRQLRDLAERDPLTGLPNRRHLLALLEDALTRRASRLVAVFFLDLDNFKNINDSMGHGFGDEVLKAVAERLSERVGESGFAARLGGDEFTVVLTSAANADEVRQAGLAVIGAFESTLHVDDRDLLISISVGVSICPTHDTTAEGLLKAADAALFRAKALGRSQLSVFTPELLSEAAAKFATEQGLRRALERGEFALMFQPEFDSETLRPVLVEALVRWRLPSGRLASPGEFLPVAEESRLIVDIGDWVLRAAVEAAANWHHGEWPDARVAVNVSARQLLDHRFVDKVKALLIEHDLPPRCLEIELTETVLQTGPATLDKLHKLRTAGIATALDDFGTGYSALASLEKLPLSRIKLDKSLIDGIVTSPRSAAVAQAIIWLCHSLGLEVTAEGLEGPDQLAALRHYRPLLLQGYLLSHPVLQEDVVGTLKRLSVELPLLLPRPTAVVEELLSYSAPALPIVTPTASKVPRERQRRRST